MKIKLTIVFVLLIGFFLIAHTTNDITVHASQNAAVQYQIAHYEFITMRSLYFSEVRDGVMLGYSLLFNNLDDFFHDRDRDSINSYDAMSVLQIKNGFRQAIEALSPGQVWADMGAGSGLALSEYLREFSDGGSVIVVSLVEPPKRFLFDSERSRCVIADARTVD